MISNLCLSANGYKVIKSESVIMPSWNSDLCMDVTFESGFDFKITFQFIENDGKKDELIKKVDGKTIIFECINCDSVTGNGTKDPVSIATVEGKTIFFHFMVYTRGKKEGRKIEYTFFEKE